MTDLTKFQKMGTTKIEETTSDTEKEILIVLRENPSKHYTQPEFVEGLGKSNPFINKTLRKLVEKGLVERKKGGNKWFYKISTKK